MTESHQPPHDRTGRPPRRPASVTDIFGDVLPDTTSDERAPETRPTETDSWYLDNRPPHHDR